MAEKRYYLTGGMTMAEKRYYLKIIEGCPKCHGTGLIRMVRCSQCGHNYKDWGDVADPNRPGLTKCGHLIGDVTDTWCCSQCDGTGQVVTERELTPKLLPELIEAMA